jgi:hypothetical protein
MQNRWSCSTLRIMSRELMRNEERIITMNSSLGTKVDETRASSPLDLSEENIKQK